MTSTVGNEQEVSMPQKVTIEGVETEVFTAEEVAEQAEVKAKELADTKVAEETERLNTEHESALLEKDEALKEAQEKLDKAAAKELNFKALREKNEKGSKEKSEEEKKNAEDLKALQETVQAIQKQPFETAKSSFVKQNVGVDKELGEKFDFFYKKLSSGVKTVEEQQIALESAMTLATGKPYEAGSGRMTGVSVDPGFGGEKGKQESQDSQNFGALLGLTAEDKKKFAPALASNTVPLFYQTPPKEKNV
jgi:hypothetical protein